MATYKKLSVSGFEEFDQAVKEHQGKTIFAYFSGSKDAEGKSWCPDCVEGPYSLHPSVALIFVMNSDLEPDFFFKFSVPND
ncbi:Thioredoxin domain-containing protein 17 [Microtus ochrogaster]|uniref:Thioredoxin domain-containing protein 17 n=1 Tax=Microtus ochrogaster TaxID=79684 RepID=A0A8J6GDL3_MICOH|nr:Thioredoxin domain-containing protein 17 [Microtus ochrogaster]